MAASLNRRRLALFALFLLPGLSIASWVTRTPAIRDALGASTAQMGLILFGLSVGSMAGILCSGPLVSRLGARPVIAFGTLGVVIAVPTIGLGAAMGLPALVTCGLAVFGAGMGGGEVAMNVEGAEFEKVTRRPFLPALHGCFSLGTVLGAVLGIAANAGGFPVVWHLVLIGIAGAALLVWSVPALPPDTGRVTTESRAAAHPDGVRTALWRDARLLGIGGIVLAMALAEGTANDWLPLVMVDGHGFDATLGSAVYAVFAASMTLGRFVGGPIVQRAGRAPVLCVSALLGAGGIALISFVDSQPVAAAAVVLWGLGASLGFPVALSAAGDSGPMPAARVALASTIGYLAFLVGPPVLGLVGDAVGLRGALVIPLTVVALAALLAPATRTERRSTRSSVDL